jgi:hypothetical protein
MVQAILLNITPRLFAITIRATLFGCCYAIGELGTVGAYLLFVFQPLTNVVYIVAEIGITLSLATLCSILIDVDSRELPDMVDDMDYFSE